MLNAHTLRTLATAVEILDNPTPMPAPMDANLAQFCDDVIMLDNAGILADTLAPAPVRKARTLKADPTVGTGSNLRMTLRGVEMPTDKPASTKRIVAIQDNFDRKSIVKAARKLKLHGKSLHTLNVADASDLLFTLKNA
jgi:hypothetical protein